MEECNRFDKASRLYQICTGIADLPKFKINKYREKWGLEPLFDDVESERYVSPKVTPKPTVKPIKIKYGPGTELLKIYKDAGIPSCQACHELANKMNDWGIQGCEDRLDEIVDDILPRAMTWIAENATWADKLFPNIVKETAVRIKIGNDISKAIKNAKENKNIKNIGITNTQKLGGCSRCGKKKVAKAPTPNPDKPLILSTTFGPIHKDNNLPPYKGVESVPFDGDPVVNLMYHIYPYGDHWRWNLDQLMDRIDLFNGRRIVGIAVNEKVASEQEVRKYLGSHIHEYIIVKNHPKEHEMATFQSQLAELETNDPRHITFRGHAKGVVQFTRKEDHILDWVEMLYRTNLDQFDLVKEHLTNKAFTGSCRKFNQFNKGVDRATYSGSFYWFRNCFIYGRGRHFWFPKHNFRWACEEWPGLVVKKDDTECLFLDDAKRLYSVDYWNNTVLPLYEEWKQC